jgi:hypothetical protein
MLGSSKQISTFDLSLHEQNEGLTIITRMESMTWSGPWASSMQGKQREAGAVCDQSKDVDVTCTMASWDV